MITIPGLNITLTDILATWGAVLATASIIWQIIIEVQKNRPHVKVNCFVGKELIDVPGVLFRDKEDHFVESLTIEAVNTGHRSVTITAVGFRVDKEWDYVMDNRKEKLPLPLLKPRTLDGWKTSEFYFEPDDAELNFSSLSPEQLNRCRAFVHDAEGHEYSTKLSKEWVDRFKKNTDQGSK